MTFEPFTNSAGSVAPTTTSVTVSTVQAGVAFADPFYANVAILV
jgi:hypothetical protein